MRPLKLPASREVILGAGQNKPAQCRSRKNFSSRTIKQLKLPASDEVEPGPRLHNHAVDRLAPPLMSVLATLAVVADPFPVTTSRRPDTLKYVPQAAVSPSGRVVDVGLRIRMGATSTFAPTGVARATTVEADNLWTR